MIHNSKNKQGFTLIEMIVSLGVFSVVVTTAVGAFLVLISTNQRLQAEQNVMTNLAFAMDTMTREIRTGYNYYCASNAQDIFIGNNGQEGLNAATRDCPNGIGNGDTLHGVSFYEGGNSITGNNLVKRILYFFDKTNKTIMRRVGDNTAQSIVSSGVDIIKADFVVTGSETFVTDPANPDVEQPTVTIFIEAIETGGNVATDKHYYLQTTVTQRILDL